MFHNTLKMLAVLTYFAVIITLTLSQNVSEECTLNNGQKGHCLPLSDCDIAQEDLKDKAFPLTCQIAKTEGLVCCVKNHSTEMKTKKSISAEKCEEYSKLFAETRGGHNAPAKLYPHMVLLGYGDEDNINWACRGNLISEKFVLTAAHCINPKSINEVKFVRLGDLILSETEDDAEPQIFTVIRTFVHPQFKSPSVYNDVGLIELDRPAIFGAYVLPACLQTEKYIDNNTWIATGWGATNNSDTINYHITVANIGPYPIEECRNFYNSVSPRRLPSGIDDELQICASDVGKEICRGDSGGPLQVSRKSGIGWKIIGISSFGKSCDGSTPAPGVYTRVSNYIEWIESIVWP